MRIPPWSPEKHPQNEDLLNAILARRDGQFLQLDRALLWSEPLARGWNVYLKAVRSELPTDWRLRELGICTVALLTGARYEYKHHAPDFLKAGGTQEQLDGLNRVMPALKKNTQAAPADAALSEIELLVIHYAAQMTLNVHVQDSVADAMRQHFDTTQFVEITAAIATYNMVARFLIALQINPEDGR